MSTREPDLTPWTRQPGDPAFYSYTHVLGPSQLPKEVAASVEHARRNTIHRDMPMLDGILTLRDYQLEATRSVFAAWDAGKTAPLIVLPTGTGKAIIAANLMASAKALFGWRTIFLAHRKELLTQAKEKFFLVSNLGTAGIVQGSTQELNCDVTICSSSTIGGKSRKRLDRILSLGKYDLLVIDEAHHAPSATFMRVVDRLKEANPDLKICGMTATPGRADGTALDVVFDDVCFSRDIWWAVEEGWLVPPRGFAAKINVDLGAVSSDGGDYKKSQLSKVMNTEPVNEAIVRSWMQYGHDRKTLIFSVDVAHAKALAKEFNAAGYDAGVVDGTMKDQERKKVLKQFRSGDIKLLVSCEVLTEGYDDPSIESILLARPTQSQGLCIQMIGRGLRLHPGKTECLIIDCVENLSRHKLSQLATTAGLDPEKASQRGGLLGEDGELPAEEDDPEVRNVDIHGREIDLQQSRVVGKSKYSWRETRMGWVLQIPRVGYYMVAWCTSGAARGRCLIRFYDQRPGRHNDPPREIVRDPISFEMAYGMVEAELDRFVSARSNPKHQGKEKARSKMAQQAFPDINFVDLEDGLDEDTEVPESLMMNNAHWRTRGVSHKQEALLKKYGVKSHSMPTTMGEASDLITIMRVERDAKMRMPATLKQIRYLQHNGLEVRPNMTKGQAAALIWPHRKMTGK